MRHVSSGLKSAGGLWFGWSGNINDSRSEAPSRKERGNLAYLTVDRVKEHFKEICFGDVVRHECPNMLALNFLLSDSLGGGGSESLLTDAQGKTHGLALLEMEVER